jgi:RNA polymerase sigma-70 factor (ECF subfamily)
VTADAELLEAWRAGDEAAGRTLFRRYFEIVRRFFATKVPSDAEDLVQRTFLGCLRARDQFRGDGSFRGYLLTAARRELIDHYRARGRQQHAFDPAVTSLCDLDPSPSRVASDRQEQRLLLEALRRLPLDDQILLELTYWEELGSRELGEVLGVPAPTIRGRLRKARSRLEVELRRLGRSTQALEATLSNLEEWARSLRDLVESS